MLPTPRNRLYAFLIIAALISFCDAFGLPGLPLNKPQEITAFIVFIAAILWISEVVPLFVVSFVILALELVWLLPALHLVDISLRADAFYTSFFSDIILLFVGGFVLSSLMQKYGLDLRFAHSILQRTQGKPQATLLGVISVCAFLSMWISNTATAAMMLAIAFPIIKHIPEDNDFRIALVLSIPFSCNIGGLGTPIGTPPNAIALSYLSEQGISLDFMQWMGLTFPFLLFFLFILWCVLLWIYPPGRITVKITQKPAIKLSSKQWAAIAIFISTAICWFFTKQLKLSTGTVALLPIIASFWSGLLITEDFRKLPWDILYIICGGLALGVALNVSGLGALIVNGIPLDTPPLLLIAVITLVAGTMSTIMSNTATAGLVIPLIMSLHMNHVHILTLVLAIALMCSMAMALPITTPPNAIAFSARAIRTKDMIIAGGFITVIGFMTILALGPWYWRMVIRFLHIV